MSKLALYGGSAVKTTPFGTGRRFGQAELDYLAEALEQNSLFYWRGTMVKRFLARFAELYDMPYAVATSSGTASLHVAVGALDIAPGEEVITSPITDAGTYIGILYQQAIPVFADLDPHSYNMTAASIERVITPRTRAIMVVHLAGNPADMDPILELARKHNLLVIEDCAQSYEAFYHGRRAGTMGDIGCFSTNDFKHISTGDGGMVLMRDETLYHRALRFADKNYQRLPSAETLRNADRLAPNYRMTELQGAVGLAQLERLEGICARRSELGERLSAGIRDLPGIHVPHVQEGCRSSYWFYMLRLDPEVAGVDRQTFSDALKAEGIPNSPGYIPAVVYAANLFQNQTAFATGHLPFELAPSAVPRYAPGSCPEAEAILKSAVRLTINEFYTDSDIDDMIMAIRKVCDHFRRSPLSS
ncbi:MAG: DegT/DnrJ/EryC1/StrS family aminotransferase [Bacillota bacterium]|nr:DegT/DnrJ/EryC1/StrS family aminotransferase [Bacillota bacterium]